LPLSLLQRRGCELQGLPHMGETATVVITDIQGSSRLWATCPAEMNVDIEKHDRLLRHMMLLYNGIELATEGDSFQVNLCKAAPCSPNNNTRTAVSSRLGRALQFSCSWVTPAQAALSLILLLSYSLHRRQCFALRLTLRYSRC
jgi:class 3 adenylate cyclase